MVRWDNRVIFSFDQFSNHNELHLVHDWSFVMERFHNDVWFLNYPRITQKRAFNRILSFEYQTLKLLLVCKVEYLRHKVRWPLKWSDLQSFSWSLLPFTGICLYMHSKKYEKLLLEQDWYYTDELSGRKILISKLFPRKLNRSDRFSIFWHITWLF